MTDQVPDNDLTAGDRLLRQEGSLNQREQKLAQRESALRARELRFYRYLDLATTLVVSLNPHGTITLINSHGCQLLGYSREEIIGCNWFEMCVPARLRTDVIRVFSHFFDGAQPVHQFYENPVLTRSGEERIINWHNTLLYDEQGAVAGTLSSGEDITEKLRAARKLEESEERYRTLFDMSPVGIGLAGEDGRIIEANTRMLEMGRYPQNYPHPIYLNQIYASPEDLRRVEEELRNTGFIASHESTFRRLDGGTFIGRTSVRPIVLQERPAMLAVVEDITDQKIVEMRELEKTKRLRLLREMDQAILTSQLPEDIAHNAVCRIAELLSCDRGIVLLLDKASGQPTVLAEQHRCGQAAEKRQQIEFSPQDTAHLLELMAVHHPRIFSSSPDKPCLPGGLTPLLDAGIASCIVAPLITDGEPFGILLAGKKAGSLFTSDHQEILADVAGTLSVAIRQARLLEQIRGHAAEMERTVEIRTRQLHERMAEVVRLNAEQNELLDELKVSNQALQHISQDLRNSNKELQLFAYTISHDLQAPLRALQGYASILAEDHAGQLDEEGLHHARRISQVANGMDRLIKDLLAFSRMNRYDAELQSVPLGSVVEEAVRFSAMDISQTGARITVKGPLESVYGHPTILVHVVTNLLSNAIKYVAPQVIPEVQIWSERRGNAVRLWIEDNGIGVPEEYREKIFLMFERLHTDGEYPGTGVGLAIVRRGVERLQGQAGMEAGDKGGSRFWIELPVPPRAVSDAGGGDAALSSEEW